MIDSGAAARDRPIEQTCFRMPFAWVKCYATHDAVVGLDMLPLALDEVESGALAHPLLMRVREQCERYLEAATPFSLPLQLSGTAYQERIWAALQGIAPGQTRSYARLAHEQGGSPRSVAGACRANPVALIIPCHRVVATRGLGGYSGESEGPMLDIKRWLLAHEGACGH